MIITGFLFLAFPTATLAADYAPCAQIADEAMRYQCRRSEAISYVRLLNTEFRQNSRATILSISDKYAKELKNIYKDYSNLSSADRAVYVNELKDRRLAAYIEWYVEEQELLEGRRNLRKLTRFPNNKELRMELIQEKGAFLDSRGNLKKTRRTVVEEQLNFIRSFAN